MVFVGALNRLVNRSTLSATRVYIGRYARTCIEWYACRGLPGQRPKTTISVVVVDVVVVPCNIARMADHGIKHAVQQHTRWGIRRLGSNLFKNRQHASVRRVASKSLRHSSIENKKLVYSSSRLLESKVTYHL